MVVTSHLFEFAILFVNQVLMTFRERHIKRPLFLFGRTSCVDHFLRVFDHFSSSCHGIYSLVLF
jgi:hypothetical protein